MKKILITLEVDEESKFNEEEFIKNVLKAKPNKVVISMREVYGCSNYPNCKHSVWIN